MKKILLFLVMLITLRSFAQDTTYIEQYCRLDISERPLSNKVAIDVDFGESRRLFADYRLRDEETGKLKKFNSIIDALNYMGSQGWSLVNAFQVNSNKSTSPSYEYIFKKTFRRTDLR
jgi:hypothetical protein